MMGLILQMILGAFTRYGQAITLPKLAFEKIVSAISIKSYGLFTDLFVKNSYV